MLLIFCPRLSLKRTCFILTGVTCNRENSSGLNTILKIKIGSKALWATNLHAFSRDASAFHDWEILLCSHWKNSYMKKKRCIGVIWDGRAHKNVQLLLPQMFKNSLKRQNLLVLTLMGFQLVPLVERLSTALMITLKENKDDEKTAYHKIWRKTKRHMRKQDCCTLYCFFWRWCTRAMWVFKLVVVTKASEHPSATHLEPRAGNSSDRKTGMTCCYSRK